MKDPWLHKVCVALGWQGGTIHQVIAEIERLRAEATKPRPFLLDACQLRQAIEFAAPDYDMDEDQRGTWLCIADRPAGQSVDGEDVPAGTYCWYQEYPEEGALLLEPYEGLHARLARAAEPEGKTP